MSIILYHLCGGGSATNYRKLPDSVIKNAGYSEIADDLIKVRGPLLEELKMKKRVFFMTPGGMEPDGSITLEQMANVAKDIARSYFHEVKRLLDNDWQVYTYLGMPVSVKTDSLQHSLLPWLELSKQSIVGLDSAATDYVSTDYQKYVDYLATAFPAQIVVEGEPLPKWNNTPVVLATGNQPWKWRTWLKDHRSNVLAILQGGTVSNWPTPSVSQAKSMFLQDYIPVLDFWLLTKDTVSQW